MTHRAIALILVAALPMSAFAAEPSGPLSRSAQQQASIKANTRQASKDLAAIVAEYERNGLGDDGDAKALSAFSGMLDKLSEKDMEQVIALLNAAAADKAATAGQPGENGTLAAYKGQRNIATELRMILIKYQRDLDLKAIALQFARLADTQDDNFKETRNLAQKMNGKGRAWGEDKMGLQIRQSVQAGIKDEAVALLPRLLTLASQMPADDPLAGRIAEVAKTVKKGELEKTLSTAVTELAGSNILSAVGTQRVARDQLRELSRMMEEKKDDITALENAAQEIDKRIEEQKHLNSVTKETKESKPLANTQADIVDKTDQTKKDLSTVAPAAAAKLSDAMDNMQEARPPLAEGTPAAAQPPQASALKNLEGAKSEVEKKLEKLKADMAAAEPPKGGDPAGDPPPPGDGTAEAPPPAGDPAAPKPGDPGEKGAAKMGAAAGMEMSMGMGMPMDAGLKAGMTAGMSKALGLAMVNENMAKASFGDRKDTRASASSATGPRVGAGRVSMFIGLPPRDRLAIEQSRSERYPAEYSSQIEQYLKNLSESGE